MNAETYNYTADKVIVSEQEAAAWVENYARKTSLRHEVVKLMRKAADVCYNMVHEDWENWNLWLEESHYWEDQAEFWHQMDLDAVEPTYDKYYASGAYLRLDDLLM